MIHYSDLETEYGVPVGEYTLRLASCNDQFRGATFVNGVTTEPVLGRDVMRLFQAFGAALVIERYEADESAPAPLPDTLPPPPPEEPTEAAAPAVVETTPTKATSNLSDKELEALSLDDLRALAEKLGAEFDGRWTERRLIRAIKAARG